MIKDIPCVILAGGKSSRMGEDKSLLPFEKYNTLIEYQYSKLSQIFKDVYISSKTDKFNFNAELILDNSDIYSPMIALKTILEQFNNKVFIIGVDIPFVKEETIKTLIKKSDNYDITIASDSQYTHNLCGIYNCNLLLTIDDLINKNIHKINYLVKNHNSQIVKFDNSEEFLNLNTQQQYQEAIKTLKL